MQKVTVGVVGNPNSGKSTIFNELTGLNQRTGNWSGVTTDKKIGNISIGSANIQLVDLPGLYSLGIGRKKSLDQKIVSNFIKEGEFDYFINVIDSTNFKRNLYLTLQLLECKIPMILVLNMSDVAVKKGMLINEKKLSKILNCSIIQISAKKKSDILRLRNFLIDYKSNRSLIDIFSLYSKGINNYYNKLENFLKLNKRQLSYHDKVMLMEGSLSRYDNEVDNFITAMHIDIEKEFGETSDFVLVNSRYALIDDVVKQVLRFTKEVSYTVSDILDNVFLNRFLAIPIFFFIAYLMFVFSINVGGILQGLFNLLAQATFIDIPLLILSKVYNVKWLNIIVQGVGGAIQTIVSFIPIIATMYIFLSFLEDSGYIARVAVIANKFSKYLGLSGQSFFPLITGLGCNVPAITSTKILNNHYERISIVMMLPFISCTARLAVYVLFCFIFFPNYTQNIIFFLYVLGIAMAVVTGLLIKNSDAPNYNMFIELPEYKLPKIKVIFSNSFLRTKSFVFEAGKTIVLVFLIIHLISVIKIPVEGVENVSSDKPLINVIGQKISPIFKPIGLEEKNWPAVVGIITGIFAKEVVVGTLVSLYGDNREDIGVRDNTDIVTKYKEALINSIPRKVKMLFIKSSENIGAEYSSDVKSEHYEKNKLTNTVIANIRKNFNDKVTVLAYLIFILIYFPCVSVFGAISKEIGKKWAIISAVWSIVSAYSVSVVFYQMTKMVLHRTTNYKFLLLGIIMFISFAYFLRVLSNKSRHLS